jgi:GH25 family lysozyme M1 (1,4-beta-N-acetylmuramidase)
LFNVSTDQCLKSKGYKFAIVRVFQSFGNVDPHGKQNLINAHKANLTTGAYMFPCRSKSANSQVDSVVKELDSTTYDYLWLDIETNPSKGCGWSSNTKSNCDFLMDLINRVKHHKKNPAVYCSEYMWKTIMGSDQACPQAGTVLLWYPHYNGVKNFNDFKPFGGWKKPLIKQFSGTNSVCGARIDMNVRV